MNFRIITPPSIHPVSLAEAKLHLRVDNDEEDDYISALIAAATAAAQNYTGRQFINAVYETCLDAWPCDTQLYLLMNPVQSIAHIKYYNASNSETTMVADTDYQVDTLNNPCRIVFKNTYTLYDRVNAITVRFTAGYGTAATNVPGDIVAAIKLILGDLYENRQNEVVGTITSPISTGSKSLLHPYRLMSFR